MLNRKFTEVRRFIRATDVHLDAARRLLAACPEKTSSTRAHDVIYLSGYVIECALKALLLSRYPEAKHKEMIERFKSAVKHDLEKLKRELSKKKVELPEKQQENLKRVRPVWSSEMRYDIRAWHRDEAERIFLAVEAIYDWVNGS